MQERRHRDPPAVVDLAETFSRGTLTSVKKISLNSGSPVICRSGRTSTPGECMSTSRYVMPLCLGASGSVRTSEDAVVGDVSEGRPHLLSVDDEVVAVVLGPRPQRREVGARARLREALTPDLLAGQDLG